MVTLDEQRQLKIENAEANERFWAGHRDYLEGTVTDHEAFAAKAERVITTGRTQAAEAAANAVTAKDAANRLRRGEDVPVEKPLTREDMERIYRDAGLTTADLRHCELLASLPKDVLPIIRDAAVKASNHAPFGPEAPWLERRVQPRPVPAHPRMLASGLGGRPRAVAEIRGGPLALPATVWTARSESPVAAAMARSDLPAAHSFKICACCAAVAARGLPTGRGRSGSRRSHIPASAFLCSTNWIQDQAARIAPWLVSAGCQSRAPLALLKIALPQNHWQAAVFIVRNGSAPLQMPEHRPFRSGMVGRRPF